jgi:hypothetical protein
MLSYAYKCLSGSCVYVLLLPRERGDVPVLLHIIWAEGGGLLMTEIGCYMKNGFCSEVFLDKLACFKKQLRSYADS